MQSTAVHRVNQYARVLDYFENTIIILGMYTINIRQGKEKQLLRHHPWVFTGAIEKTEPEFTSADWARVLDHDGRFIAYGYYDERSHIVLHLLSWNEKEVPDEDWIRARIGQSVKRRRDFFSKDSTTNCFRIIHGEADFLPGLAADCYARMVKIIVSSRFAYRFIDVIASELDRILHPDLISASTDPAYASAEGFGEKTFYYRNGMREKTDGSQLGNTLVLENGIYYEIGAGRGQKSGFYCDQRENRTAVEKYASGALCLDVCSFTGAFTLHLLKAGAAGVKAIDSSESALRHLLYQVHLNEDKGTIAPGSRDKVCIQEGDCFELVRMEKDGSYDLIILDPPKLAKTKGQLENAMKAYKDLNRVAMMKLKNDGILVSFSCSASLTREDLRTVIAWSAKDAGVEAQILETLSAGSDHPVRLSFPESEYLKGFILRIMKD